MSSSQGCSGKKFLEMALTWVMQNLKRGNKSDGVRSIE